MHYLIRKLILPLINTLSWYNPKYDWTSVTITF